MKKSIFSWFGFIIPLPERLELIKKNGFDATCLWWEDEVYPNTIEKSKMPMMVKDAGLFLDNIHCPYEGVNSLWSGELNKRKRVLDNYLQYIDDCSRYSIKNMVMHASDVGFEKATLNGIKRFERLVMRAEDNGVRIAVENTRDYELIELLLSEIDSPVLGMCYDSSHDWIAGQSRGQILSKWSHRLLCTHLSDNDMEEDRHWIPGDGEVDWDEVMSYILNSQIDAVTMEVLSSKEPIGDPTDYLRTASKRLNELMSSRDK